MGWQLKLDELPNLHTAFADVAILVGPAFSAVVEPFGLVVPEPKTDPFRSDQAEWRISWLLHLPDRFAPYETIRCE